MKLTDTAIRNAKPAEKAYKMFDGIGMFLYVEKNGTKCWRLKYRFGGREKLLSLGVYPHISLKEARQKRDVAKNQLANNIDPSEAKKEEKIQTAIKAENSFEAIACEWHSNKKHGWTEKYASNILRRLESDIFTKVGHKPITQIKAPELLMALREIEKRGALELAQRALQCCGQIFMYAIATGRAEHNIAADLKGALKTPIKTNYSHLKEVELPEFLQKLEKYTGTPQTRLAIKFLILTLARTIEVRGATWNEFDFDKKEWRIPSSRMKMRREHIVPLSNQALEVLEQLKTFTGQW
jgi:integrase